MCKFTAEGSTSSTDYHILAEGGYFVFWPP